MLTASSKIEIDQAQKSLHNLLAVLIAVTLLLDDVIVYGLSTIFGRGGGGGAVVLILLTIFFLKRRYDCSSTVYLLLGFLGCLLQIELVSLSGVYISIVFILLLYIACGRGIFILPKTNIFLLSLWVVLFFNVASIGGLDVFEFVSGLEANRPVGLYSEPSHMAYYVVVLYFFSVKANPKVKLCNAIPAVALLAINFSLTALLPLVLIFKDSAAGLRSSKKYLIIASGVFVFLGFLVLKANYIAERNIFDPIGQQSATGQVLVYYYSVFFHLFENNIFFGFGPDNFFEAYTSYARQYFPMFGDLNSADGSFLLVKLTGEFGVATAFMFLFAIFRALNRDSSAVLLIFFQYTFFRGFGITSAIPISLLLLAMARTGSNALKR
ncbi:hypothetical protein ACUXVY_09880 [Chromobacterium haemolyticum]|uniref:hypothetical protein n=1 Tax=Chromobacterium haemolyticum TaxID=394935 RepID=UPI0040566796